MQQEACCFGTPRNQPIRFNVLPCFLGDLRRPALVLVYRPPGRELRHEREAQSERRDLPALAPEPQTI